MAKCCHLAMHKGTWASVGLCGTPRIKECAICGGVPRQCSVSFSRMPCCDCWCEHPNPISFPVDPTMHLARCCRCDWMVDGVSTTSSLLGERPSPESYEGPIMGRGKRKRQPTQELVKREGP